ncbi:hypothetical protein OESDEN_10596 [Oesophagostomum dentatum]|uniref:Uncharacterized protein n=1 Tax=Oesophagostomum dentatum TaxID=61180 RepID=A0A0B1T2H1_OESDE|nr:hypothetical protein OESDEN_10596 [Oesophagostomum dentatum]
MLFLEDAANSTKEEAISPKENQKVRESGKRISLPTTKALKPKKVAVLKPKKKLANVPRRKEKPKVDSHQSLQKPESAAEKLHPSWAAKRLAKERQMAAPQSKRIVFDED